MSQGSKVPLNENAELMQKVADDDFEAFDRLFLRFAPLLMHWFVVRGSDLNSAEDLVQKIFAYLWEQRKKFRLEYSFEAYLYSIARNTLYKEIRQSHKISKKSLKNKPSLDEDMYKAFSQPEAELYFKELSEALEAAKTRLTNEQYQALEASQARDVPLSRILEDLGCSLMAYKGLIKRARRRLKDDLKSFFTDDETKKKRRNPP